MNNPFAQPLRPVQLTLEADSDTLNILELRLEEQDQVLALTRPLDSVKPHLVLIVEAAHAAHLGALAEQIAPGVTIHSLPLADIDWVTQVQKDFPPFALGRFYVYGSHAKASVPRNHHPLLIDAVAAFGTGEHATTAGCLLALEGVRKRWKNRPDSGTGRRFSILDMGCGTAILGIGAARLWKNARITACDNDPMAVRVAAVNLKANRIAHRAVARVSDGYRYGHVQRLPPQPVIVANILAKPLMRMARSARRTLASGGTLILSGLLNDQENRVLAAHRAQGIPDAPPAARQMERADADHLWPLIVFDSDAKGLLAVIPRVSRHPRHSMTTIRRIVASVFMLDSKIDYTLSGSVIP